MRIKKFAVPILTSLMLVCSAIPALAAGFVRTNQGWKYQWGSGDYCYNGWVAHRSHWYYFGSDELLRTGWIQKDGTWYFASESGALQAGLLKINGNVYYMDSNSCKLVTGNRTINGVTYNFTENGTTNGSPYVYTEWNSDGTIRRGVSFKAR